MRVKLTLTPVSKDVVQPVSYNYFLTSLIYRFISNSSQDYSRFLHDEGYRLGESKKGFKLFTYSMLHGEEVRVNGNTIRFGEGRVTWQISSPVDAFLQHLIDGVFSEGQGIRIGTEGDEVMFLIERVETLPRPEFKGMMRFTCLSPITVSRVSGIPTLEKRGRESHIPTLEKGGEGGFDEISDDVHLHCHYLRPWEDGFSEAIKSNLVKKYKLVTGNELADADFRIKIDTEYMNKKNGKVTKNINFK